MSKTIKTYGALLGLALIMSAPAAIAADVEYTYPIGKGYFSKPATASNAAQAHWKATPASEYLTGKAGQRQGRTWDDVSTKGSHPQDTASAYPTGKAGKR